MHTDKAPHSWRELLVLFVISFGVTSLFQWRQDARAASPVIVSASEQPAPLRVAGLDAPEKAARIEAAAEAEVAEQTPDERVDTQDEDTAIAAIVAAESAD